MMSTPSGEAPFGAHDREWTGSCANLAESLRMLAIEFMNKSREHPDTPLSSYLQDHAYTLGEWGDAVDALYARLDEGELVTNAQGIALAAFLRRGWMNAERRFQFASVARGGDGLPETYLLVRMGDGFTGGIDPDGRTST